MSAISSSTATAVQRGVSTLIPNVSMMAHMFDHPATIRAADKFVPLVYPLGSALLLGRDYLKAEGAEEKRRVLLRDALVLGATWAGTYFATRKFMPLETQVFQEIKETLPSLYASILKEKDQALKLLAPEGELLTALKSTLEEQESLSAKRIWEFFGFSRNKLKAAATSPEALAHAKQALEDVLPLAEKKLSAYFKRLSPLLNEVETFAATKQIPMPKTVEEVAGFKAALEKAGLTLKPEQSTFLGEYLDGIVNVLDRLKQEAAAGDAGAKEQLSELLENLKENSIRPMEKSEIWEEIAEAREFFTVGFFSVASGVLGGLLANQTAGGEREVRINIFKEAAFQFIANIALCAVGAIIGLTAANAMKVQNRLGRFGIISAGLSLGICGGGYIANFLGRTLINPFCDWFDGQEKTLDNLKGRLQESWARKEHTRRIEFSDVILHLDDLPTALAIAGMKIFGPFIPPFFAFSGYRAGIGYRNSHDNPAGESQTADTPHFGHDMPSSPSRLLAQNSVFQVFYEQQHGHPEQLTPRFGAR